MGVATSNLASQFDGLMLQADAQLPTSPAQQQQNQQAVLQGVTYHTGLPVAGNSQSGSFAYNSADAVGDSGVCLPTGAAVVSGSRSFVGYSATGGAMALSAVEQQSMQELQYYQQQ
jgi:hypothetical protein